LITGKPNKSIWSCAPKLLIIACLSLSLTSCNLVGPKALRSGRAEYNEAIKSTEVEQFLLNIVRMRYGDRPYVLEISSISSRLEVGGDMGVGGGTSDSVKNLSWVGGNAHVTYMEKPTIVYQPLKGKDFTAQLLRPIDLTTLQLLRESGWELDDIFRIFVSEINGIPNAVTGASSTPEGVPEFREFLKVVGAMDKIEDNGSLELSLGPGYSPKELLMGIKPEERNTENFHDFSGMLRLDPDIEVYRIRLGYDDGGGKEIVVRTRSILAAMFFVGQGVEVPEEDLRAGYVHINRDKNGQPFDWHQVHDNLIKIHSSRERPNKAYAAVPYGDHWFYVDWSDTNSKETLTMLSIVFTLNASNNTQAPLLTIPID
jgi:hypothetical protein